VLVIENAATWHSYCRWNTQRAVFSAVVYGDGKRFVDGIRYMSDIFAELGGTRGVLYFGDLDIAGVRIPHRASAHMAKLGFPQIESDLRSYRWLLECSSIDFDEPGIEPASVAEIAWLGELASAATKLLGTGHRLAQEHIGWEFLASRCE